MKIKKVLLFVVILICLFAIPNVFAANDIGFNICKRSGIVKAFQILGSCMFILKIVIPLILIIMGSMDFGRAIIASDNSAIQTAGMMLAKRAIAGVVIFFIPTIIGFFIELVDKADARKEFDCLNICLTKPTSSECKIPKDGGIFAE